MVEIVYRGRKIAKLCDNCIYYNGVKYSTLVDFKQALKNDVGPNRSLRCFVEVCDTQVGELDFVSGNLIDLEKEFIKTYDEIITRNELQRNNDIKAAEEFLDIFMRMNTSSQGEYIKKLMNLMDPVELTGQMDII